MYCQALSADYNLLAEHPGLAEASAAGLKAVLNYPKDGRVLITATNEPFSEEGPLAILLVIQPGHDLATFRL